MPRNHQRKLGARRYKAFTENDLAEALAAIRGGMSQAEASKRWNISRGTLQNRLKGAHNRPPGHPTVFQPEEEQLLTKTLAQVSDWGFPMTKVDIRDVLHKYLEKQGRTVKEFKDNTPGPDFVEHFISRNNLSARLASNIKRSRAAVGPNDIREFFANIESSLKDIDPHLVFNYDETNIQDDPGAKKVIVPRGTKRVERVQQHSKASVSVMVCGDAAGNLLPPMVVYKSVNLYDNWMKGGPPGTIYANSPSGWFDMNLFEKWFFDILLPKIRELDSPEQKIIVGDNLASHFSPTVIQACEDNNIYLTPLPPNSTHLMQPLDVAVFAPMKKLWREILDKWRKETRSSGSIPKEYFPTLLNRLWTKLSVNVSKNLISGFRATGLCPFNPLEVLKKIPDGLIDNREQLQDNMNQSFIEVLQEMRGSNKETKIVRKRGKKVEPGKRLQTEVPEKPADAPKEPAAVAGTSGKQLESRSSDSDEDTTVSAVTKSLALSPREQPRRATKKQKIGNFCAACTTNWSTYQGPDWIRCIECQTWICGICNGDSKDPLYTCDKCTNMGLDSDDSVEDVDFVV